MVSIWDDCYCFSSVLVLILLSFNIYVQLQAYCTDNMKSCSQSKIQALVSTRGKWLHWYSLVWSLKSIKRSIQVIMMTTYLFFIILKSFSVFILECSFRRRVAKSRTTVPSAAASSRIFTGVFSLYHAVIFMRCLQPARPHSQLQIKLWYNHQSFIEPPDDGLIGQLKVNYAEIAHLFPGS